MAIVGTAKLSETDSGAATSSTVTSGTLGATADTLYITSVCVSSDSGAWTGSPTLTGGSVSSWTLDTTVVFSSTNILFVFRALDSSPGGAAALTFTAPGAETYASASIAVDELAGSITTGTNAADAVIQTGTQTQDTLTATGTTVTLSSGFAAGSGAFAAFAVYGTNPNPTVEAGWTELADIGQTGGPRLTTAWRNDEDTTASCDWGTTSGVRCCYAVELGIPASGSTLGGLVGSNTGLIG